MNKLGWVVTLSLALTMIPGEAARASGTEVGVIMGSEGCPNGAAPLWIYIDNQGHKNANSRGGWIGATSSTANTRFYFCRISESQLFSGSQLLFLSEPYMVLSLGSYCPAGTLRVIRRFDADDTTRSSATNIDWQAEGLSFPVVLSDSNVLMQFCLVDKVGTLDGSLPNIGVEYGVFAAPDFGPAIATGFVYTDDEDDAFGNWNAWCEGNCAGYATGFRSYYQDSSIMYGDENTRLNIAKVASSVCFNGRCAGGETCSSCPSDCGACPVCNDFVCSGGEDCWNCPIDCGVCEVCGDGLCTSGESCTSCCSDCGPCGSFERICVPPSPS